MIETTDISVIDERAVQGVPKSLMNQVSVPYTDREIEECQSIFGDHPFLKRFETGRFSMPFARKVAATQIGYNLWFLNALTSMRIHFAEYPEFVVGFLDKHLASELGGDLAEVGLEQEDETHIASIYKLVRSLDMTSTAAMQWGEAADSFFRQGLASLIGGMNKAEALGALYADEVLAAAWFPSFRNGFERYRSLTGAQLDCSFFYLHADHVEPAHVRHAAHLVEFRKEKGLDESAFESAFVTFHAALSTWYDALLVELEDSMSNA